MRHSELLRYYPQKSVKLAKEPEDVRQGHKELLQLLSDIRHEMKRLSPVGAVSSVFDIRVICCPPLQSLTTIQNPRLSLPISTRKNPLRNTDSSFRALPTGLINNCQKQAEPRINSGLWMDPGLFSIFFLSVFYYSIAYHLRALIYMHLFLHLHLCFLESCLCLFTLLTTHFVYSVLLHLY